MKSWARLPYRCRVCRKRFYRIEPTLVEQMEEELEMKEAAAVPAAPARRRYRVVIRFRWPRILRPGAQSD